MKNVVVNYLGRNGAGPEYAYEMTKGLLECGCRVYVILSKSINNIDLWQKLPLERLFLLDTYEDKKTLLCNFFPFVFRDLKQLKTFFRNVRVDICYVPMIQPWSIFVNYIFPKEKRVVTLHDPKPHKGSNKFFDFICFSTVRASGNVVLLSETFVDYTIRKYKVKRKNIAVIPHGFFSHYSTFDAVTEISMSYNFLFFGRITKYKGLDILAEAYKKLFSERHDISLTIAGSGNFDEYRNLFDEKDNVTIVNRFIKDEEISSFFSKDKTIVVLPYTEATQSGVIPIAMKERVLIIATNVGGLYEQVDNGKLALLCNPDSDSLYNMMRYSIEHFAGLQEKVKAAENYIESLSWNRLALKILDFSK